MKFKYLLIGILAILLYSCNNDDVEAPPIDQNGGITLPDGVDWTYNPTSTELDIPPYFPDLDTQVITEEVFQLGRHLFYEKRLSRNNKVSCGTCHQQSKAFTDGLAFSVGLNGEKTRRSAMSIANLAWDDDFFWDLRSSSLEDQALQPIQDHIEMDLTLSEAVFRLDSLDLYDSLFYFAFGDTMITPQKIAISIAEFEKGLISKDSKYDKFKRGEASFTLEESMGIELFATHPGEYYNPDLQTNVFIRGGNCGDCHGGPVSFNVPVLLPNQRARNNGLEFDSERQDDGFFEFTGDPDDKGKFKVPTLRNIALTAPYMHDGRFNTLEEVLDNYNEHVKISNTLANEMYINNDKFSLYTYNADSTKLLLGLTEQEKASIIAFLNTLTDEEFISNPRYSDPFQ